MKPEKTPLTCDGDADGEPKMKSAIEKAALRGDEIIEIANAIALNQVVGGGFFSDVAGDIGDALSWCGSEREKHPILVSVVAVAGVITGVVGGGVLYDAAETAVDYITAVGAGATGLGFGYAALLSPLPAPGKKPV